MDERGAEFWDTVMSLLDEEKRQNRQQIKTLSGSNISYAHTVHETNENVYAFIVPAVPNSALSTTVGCRGKRQSVHPTSAALPDVRRKKPEPERFLLIPALAMIQAVHNRKIAANLSLLQIPLWWKLDPPDTQHRLEGVCREWH